MRKALAVLLIFKVLTLLAGLFVLFGVVMPSGRVFVDLSVMVWFVLVAVGCGGLYGQRIARVLPGESVEALRAEARALLGSSRGEDQDEEDEKDA